MADDDLPFRVELWDDKDSRLEEIIALASDYATAKSAYEGAVKRRPGRLITLRQKARVIHTSAEGAGYSKNSMTCERCQQPTTWQALDQHRARLVRAIVVDR
jgi:hypothetical protein